MKRLDLTDNIDALLEIASTPKKRKVKEQKPNPEIDAFIDENDIKAGTKRIPTYMVYYRYYIWKKTRLIDRKKFITYFKTKFEKTKTSDGIGFLLSPKGFNLTPQSYFMARAFLRQERDEKRKKE